MLEHCRTRDMDGKIGLPATVIKNKHENVTVLKRI